MVKDVSEGTFVAINCGRDEAGFCYWLGKAVKAPYKAKHDWTDHCGTTIKKGDYVIDLVYWDRPSTGDPLLFEDKAKKRRRRCTPSTCCTRTWRPRPRLTTACA